MIEIVNGRVFVEGKETVDPTLIGYAVLDAAEDNQNSVFHPVSDKSLLSIIKNQVELEALNTWLEQEYEDIQSKMCNYSDQTTFEVNWPSSYVLFNLIMMIKNGSLVFKENVAPFTFPFIKDEKRQTSV